MAVLAFDLWQTLDAILQNRLFAETDILLLLVQTLDERGGGNPTL